MTKIFTSKKCLCLFASLLICPFLTYGQDALDKTKQQELKTYTNPNCGSNPGIKIILESSIGNEAIAIQTAEGFEKSSPAEAEKSWKGSPAIEADSQAKGFSKASDYFKDRQKKSALVKSKLSKLNMKSWCDCVANGLNKDLKDDWFSASPEFKKASQVRQIHLGGMQDVITVKTFIACALAQ